MIHNVKDVTRSRVKKLLPTIDDAISFLFLSYLYKVEKNEGGYLWEKDSVNKELQARIGQCTMNKNFHLLDDITMLCERNQANGNVQRIVYLLLTAVLNVLSSK